MSLACAGLTWDCAGSMGFYMVRMWGVHGGHRDCIVPARRLTRSVFAACFIKSRMLVICFVWAYWCIALCSVQVSGSLQVQHPAS